MKSSSDLNLIKVNKVGNPEEHNDPTDRAIFSSIRTNIPPDYWYFSDGGNSNDKRSLL